jgi:NAD(P)-dependent dehydrogenase (short-subunit alcohol dehydrogenase family)
MDLKDKIVVATGSTRGYDYAIAESMLEAGASVAITGRSKETIQRASIEDLTKTDKKPEFELHYRELYQLKFLSLVAKTK